MEKPIHSDISGIMIIIEALVWFATCAAFLSTSPSALVATWLFIFWLMNIESICSAPEATGIRNRPISLQPSHCQKRNDGMDARSTPRNEKSISCSFAPAITVTDLIASANSPRCPAAASWA